MYNKFEQISRIKNRFKRADTHINEMYNQWND